MNKETKKIIIENAIGRSGLIEKLSIITAQAAQLAEEARIAQINRLLPAGETRSIEDIEQDIASEFSHFMKCTNFKSFFNKELGIDIISDKTGFRTFLSYADNDNTKIYKISPRHPFYHTEYAQKAIAFSDEKARIIQEIKQLRLELTALLSNIRSIKQLLATWPEAVDLIPTQEKASTSTALTIPIQTLNQKLGLTAVAAA
ncbi:Nmad5 family putative nucleotide modification protein [Thiolinea disciformis]|uniref:Nmad5 family putative nucleotide modification protein n=1 Tax=Thiolinea disciformis TaxID=125614 RepID=UPI00037C3BEE|nr:Nmad5 family putative nucleotide modification protein [Thiolinea disciformis]